MALDPLSAITNGIGLIMQQNAANKAADAAGNNLQFQKAVGMQNLDLQGQNTNNMLGINDQVMQLLANSGQEGRDLVAKIVAEQNKQVGDSATTRVGLSRNTADERNKLANLLAQRDVDQAKGSTALMTNAAKADRTDAFGNITYYDPSTGGFKTSLDPTLTDTSRQFGQAENARLSALQEAIARSRFDRSPSEQSIRSELTGLMSDANAQKMNDLKQAIGMSAIRTGQGGNYANLVKEIDDRFGSKLPQTLLDARNQAAQEWMARESARRSGANADLQSVSQPFNAPKGLTNADDERRVAIDNLTKTLANNAAIGAQATTTSGNRIGSAADTGFQNVLDTLNATEKEKLGTATSGNALTLNQQTNDTNRMLDALKQRIDIWSGNAARTQNAFNTGVQGVNSASAQSVGAIGKEAPNAQILGNLANNLSLSDDTKKSSTKADYSGMSDEDIVKKIVAGL